jgi:2-polyprenyl-3-methyl-5-hydroxy-6-metoxy-1,4-benzoquinol methylase
MAYSVLAAKPEEALASCSSLPSPLVQPLTDNQQLISLIVRITGRPVEEVRQRLYQEELRPGSTVAREMRRRKLPPHVWSKALIDFYDQTDAFLYELVSWNRTSLKLNMRRWIAQYLGQAGNCPLDILCFGDGLGFDSLYLALLGHRVTYFEVSRPCIKFARDIFYSAQADIRLLHNIQEIGAATYDAVLCLDVLEHVPDPPKLVGQLARWLRSSGRLLVHAPFYLVTPDFATHLRSNLKYSGSIRGLFGRQGLKLVDGQLFWLPIVFGKELATMPLGWGGVRQRILLRSVGVLFGAARLWSVPHARIAGALLRRRLQWRQGLSGHR